MHNLTLMDIGINTCYFVPDSPFIDGELHGQIIARIAELGVVHHRIPFIWSQLQSYRNGRLEWNKKGIERLARAISLLPAESQVLAAITNPPPAVAEAFFDDPATLADSVAQFFAGCLERFPGVASWEVWNEPNASDFYLSVSEGEGHRPWTPAEYVQYVLEPGARVIRAINPGAKICVAGLAENGMIGHTDRPCCISNRLPPSPRFKAMRSTRPHGQFYFIPNFLDGMLKELKALDEKCVLGETPLLYDAIACHPYPYFDVYKKVNPNLLEETIALSSEFVDCARKTGIRRVEYWITEVGCRSLDVPKANYWNERHQTEYLEELVSTEVITENFSRIYWYQLLDADSDMRQEKTFGVLDHQGKPKLAFYSLQKHAADGEGYVGCVRDDFLAGTKNCQGGFNEAIWLFRSNKVFSYAIAGLKLDNKPELYLSPGRGVNDWAQLVSKYPLKVPSDSNIVVEFGYRLILPDDLYAVEISLSKEQTGSPLCSVVIAMDSAEVFSISIPQVGAQASLKIADFSFAGAAALTGVRIEFCGRSISALLKFGEISLSKVFDIPEQSQEPLVHVGLKLIQLRNRSGYAGLSNFNAYCPEKSEQELRPPAEIGIPDDGWTFSCPRISQINQDEWVMRATQFKRQGYFAEIGGHDGVANSNTFLLERLFDWQGIVVEANPRWFRKVCENRKCVAVNYAVVSSGEGEMEFVDAGAVGGLVDFLQADIHAETRKQRIADGGIIRVRSESGSNIFRHFGAPGLIDYVSVDVEGAELDVLRSIDFSEWRICLMTVEHGGNQSKRQEIYSYLEAFGYERLRVWFEDWFFHVGNLSVLLGLDPDATRLHMERVNSYIPYNRRLVVLEEGKRARQQGEHPRALRIFQEGTKAYYPDNTHAHIETALEFNAMGRVGESIAVLDKQLQTKPFHPGLLRASIFIFASRKRFVRFAQTLERLLERHGALAEEKGVVDVITENADALRSAVRNGLEISNYKLTAEYLRRVIGIDDANSDA